MVRAGENARLINDFLDRSIVGIGWNEIGDLSKYNSKEEITKLINNHYTEYSTHQKSNFVGSIYRFTTLMKINDKVITYDPSTREYSVGYISSDYLYKPFEFDYDHIRNVVWEFKIPKDNLSPKAQKALGPSIPTFEVSEIAKKELLISSKENLLFSNEVNESFYKHLNSFLTQARTKNLKTKNYPKNYLGTNVKVSFGQGNSAKIPWIAFLIGDNSVSDGFYPVYLYFKKQELLILAYGISETNQPTNNWNRSGKQTISKYFNVNGLSSPDRYGNSYVYKTYNPEKLPSEEIINNEFVNIKVFIVNWWHLIYTHFILRNNTRQIIIYNFF
jgi:hypothetical protein